MQVASGVLSAAVNTEDPAAPKEQFAVVRGPAILPASFVSLGWDQAEFDQHHVLRDAAMDRSIEQLARRGIVLR